ncbi:hypothetical protein TWF696_002126 [Orbilia brochopaga]|uniref:Uncharacterized protein n=1 Tax=Orbilia brochopaga TaxID=3140254 RepID=A0AAV9U6Q4_9PEZI
MASPALRAASRRHVATYSKKHRSYLDRRAHDTDDHDLNEQCTKRARLSPPESEGTVVSAGDDDVLDSKEVEENSDIDSDGEDDDDGAASATTTDTNGSTTASKPNAFTISTRRRPLFKRNTAKSTNTAPSSSSSKGQQQQKLVQMQIDLDGIGAPRITCKDCGMSYVPSAAEDAKLHKRYHARVAEGLEFGTARRESIVWEGSMAAKPSNSAGSGTPFPAVRVATPREKEKENGTPGPIQRFFSTASKGAAAGKMGKGPSSSKGHAYTTEPLAASSPQTGVSTSASVSACCCVVEITRRSTSAEKKRAAEFLRFANQELSAQEVPDKVLWGVSSSPLLLAGDGNAEAVGGRFKIYLYLEGTKCVGLCLAESIREAQWAKPQSEGDDNGGIGISCSLNISEVKEPALLGISRIWTSPKHRRRGIASQLVDCATENFVYGMKMQTDKVAFSQPTDSGAWLALRWVGARRRASGPGAEGQEEEGRPGCDEGKGTGFLVYFDSV